MIALLRGFAALPLAFVAAVALAATDVPFLSGRVVDDAAILKPATVRSLTEISRAHEERTSNQVVVLTVPTIHGQSIEAYANDVFHAWGLGQKGRDNGVLVVVVPQDRKMRIEVGYGLEGVLTDAQAARIVRDRMTPRFKAGDFDGGVADGVGAIVATLEGHAAPEVAQGGGGGEPARTFASFKGFDDQLPPWPVRILLGAFIFGIIGVFTFVGIVTPGVGWFLYVFLIPFWAMFPIVVVGTRGALVCLATYVIGFPLAKLWLRGNPAYQKAAQELRSKGSTTFGGMVITSGGSGGSSSSGGGGGFSGGGGDSGGGGASGSW